MRRTPLNRSVPLKASPGKAKRKGPGPVIDVWDDIEDPPRCWFADLPGAGPCDGRLVRCHLIPKQVIARECGVVTDRPDLSAPIWDYRTWVYGCGGLTGIGGHHGKLDSGRSLRVPRDRLPVVLEEFALEHGLAWWLEREYGPKRRAA